MELKDLGFAFSLSVGGHQGSRGGDAGQEFFIENVFEELDMPGQRFEDSSEDLATLGRDVLDDDAWKL